MITNIDELKLEILRRGIAREEDLIGCDDRELESIEQRYGKLPLAYKQIMRLWGGGAEKFYLSMEMISYLPNWKEAEMRRSRTLIPKLETKDTRSFWERLFGK